MNRLHIISGITSTTIYPLTVSAGIGLFMIMAQTGYSLVYSSYLPLVLAASIIMLLEIHLPASARWSPERNDVKNDLLFMVSTQWLMPILIAPAFLLVVTLLNSLIPKTTQLWPSHWSVVSQALLMLLAADFFSYWLHRAAHHVPLLWRLHQIHHSPEKLYWLNVGRFHPLEKLLQLSLTSFPFILLGVEEQVLTLYLVFYSINGFFQHSNIRLRFGPLNYLVSSAELHRWHHSRSPKISGSNFGNNLIIWDLLFGTWFLPKNRIPKKLGLMNRSFPLDFVNQLKEPFKKRVIPKSTGLSRNNTGKIVLFLLMKLIEIIYLNPFIKAAGKPRKIQDKVLSEILNANRTTEFGKEHEFSTIGSYREYARKVPIQDYETLRPLIDRQMATGSLVLTTGKPVMYAVTSGTTGRPKYIPVYSRTLKQYRQEQSLYALLQYRSSARGMTGRTLAMASPAVEGYCSEGTPFGSASGLVYQSMPSAFQKKYVIPPEIFSIKNYDLKYKVILCLALAERNITCLVSANPSSLLRLMEIFRKNSTELIDAVAKGQLKLPPQMPPDTSNAISRSLSPDPQRASELQDLVSVNKTAMRDIWPLIDTVNTWTGGSCSIALNALKQQLPSFAHIRELGYMATELRATLPILPDSRSGLPVLHHHFFEFIKRGDWDAGKQKTVLLEQLEDRQEYYIIVTTNSGLYRYFMNDIIRVEGFYKHTPLIRFIRKGLDVTSITGEKLYQNQVIDSIEKLQSRVGRPIPFFLMLADLQEACYRLYIEILDKHTVINGDIALVVDQLLCSINLEYRHKRASKRLKPPKLARLNPGTGEEFKRFYLQCGQREGQFKPRLLQYLDECSFPISTFITDHESGRDENNVATLSKTKAEQINLSSQNLQKNCSLG